MTERAVSSSLRGKSPDPDGSDPSFHVFIEGARKRQSARDRALTQSFDFHAVEYSIGKFISA